MLSPSRLAPWEGWRSWLAIAGIVVAILGFEAWIVFGGTSPGGIAGSLSETAVLTLRIGQTSNFGPGRMDEGSVVSCENAGLVVSAAVPPRGRTTSHFIPPTVGISGVTIRIVHRNDDAVTVRCSR
jgi:hypothetical protein